tara:strand:- start:75 stop:500 length:426 start_codon:yes stop_codon:yes gene_type:complete
LYDLFKKEYKIMPAKSKAQRRFFALALQYKKGELKSSEVSDDVKELSKLPVKTLEDFVKTDEKEIPNKIGENESGTVNLNPNMNVQSMGNATLPGNPGSANSFSSQKTGSGDLLEPIKKKKKKKKKSKLLSFDKFLNILQG